MGAQGAPPAPPPPATTRPATTQPAATQPSTRPVERITLNFKDAALDAVLDHLSATAGFIVIKEGPVDGRVTVMSQQPVTPDEAVLTLGAALKANGFTALRDGRVLRIVARDKAKKGSVPVHFGSDPEQIAATDELITQVISLQNVDAVKLIGDLKPLLSPDADVTATAGSNAIIITDASNNIRRLARIIHGLDQREATVSDLRIRQLKFANAAAAAKLITSLFPSQPAGPQPGQPPMPQQPGQPPMPGGGPPGGRIPGGGVDQALRGGKVNAAADDRTNTVIITAPVETLKVIDGILTQLDENPTAAFSEIRAFPLKFAEAESTAKLITTMFQGDQGNNQGDDFPFFRPRFGGQEQPLRFKVTASFDERTNTVIVSAPASIMVLIEKLVKDLENNPVTTADLRVFQLKNADAFTVAGMLEDIFDPQDAGEDGGFIRFLFLGPDPRGKQTPKLTAVSDDRTNSVIVTAPTEVLKVVEDVVLKLDSNPAAEETLFIYRLKNAQALNLEYVLNTLFGNTNQPNQQGGPNQNQDPQQRQNDQFNNRASRNRGGGRGRGGGNANDRRGGGGSRYGDRRGGNFPGVSPGLYSAITELTGEVFVVADPDTNSLLVTTATKYEEQVRKIIDELDRPVPQVLIKVLVAEVTHTDGADFGVDFSVLNRRASGLGQIGGTNFGNAAATSGLVVSILETNVNATLRALANAGRLEVLSRPYVLASDNQLASISIGQEIPFIETSRITDTGQTINTVFYDQIGIQLYVTPHINPDGLVILDVAPEISELTDSTIPVGTGVNYPIINSRTAESRVGVRTGETVVIGGLMEDQETSTVDKVPLLGDIPILKVLFSRTRRTKSKTELLIFLTPHVAHQPEALRPMSADEMRGTKLTPNAVAPGTFQEHMRGLERGHVPQTQPAEPTAPVYRPWERLNGGGGGATTRPATRPPTSAPAE